MTAQFYDIRTIAEGFPTTSHIKALISSEHGNLHAYHTAEEVREPIHSRTAVLDKTILRLTKSFLEDFHRLKEHQFVYENMDE